MLATPEVKVASHRERVVLGKREQVGIDRDGLALFKADSLIFVNLTLAKQSVKLNDHVFIRKLEGNGEQSVLVFLNDIRAPHVV